MENQEKMNQGGEGCNCPMCHGKMCGGWGMHGHSCWYHVVRWILGIAIIMIVFSCGVMIGELKGAFESRFGYQMMGAGYQYGGGYGRAYPMMQNWTNTGGQSGAAPTTPVATP